MFDACDLAVAGGRQQSGRLARTCTAPVTGATNVMSLQIGENRAKELSILRQPYTDQQAPTIGLVNNVVVFRTSGRPSGPGEQA
jgi:2-ketocyclohexanecarboxyl-CoA hydrolase